MPQYRIYDAIISTTFPFRFPLLPTDADPTVVLDVVEGTRSTEGAALLFESRHREEMPPLRRVERLPECDLITFRDDDQAEIAGDRIRYRLADPEKGIHDFVEVRLWAACFTWWMLRRGQMPIHGGTVWLEDGPVLFLAVSGTGKSSMLASLVAQGHPLIADDISPVWIDEEGVAMVSSAYPQMRMWPETARQFVGDPEILPRVIPCMVKRRVHVGETWGSYRDGRFPLSRIFLLNRSDQTQGAITMDRLTGHEAFMELLRAMFKGPAMPIRELEPVWAQLDEVVQQVPIWRLNYPSGWEHLPDVHAAILNSTPARIL